MANDITIPSVTVPVQTVTTTQVACDKLWISRLSINADGLDQKPIQLNVSFRPYAVGQDGTRTYAAPDQLINRTTRDLYAAMANVPALAAWMAAGFDAAIALETYIDARKADWDAANAVVHTAQNAVNAAQITMTNNTDSSQTSSLQSTLTAAQATLKTANDRATVARLAWSDPANPKLV